MVQTYHYGPFALPASVPARTEEFEFSTISEVFPDCPDLQLEILCVQQILRQQAWESVE